MFIWSTFNLTFASLDVQIYVVQMFVVILKI